MCDEHLASSVMVVAPEFLPQPSVDSKHLSKIVSEEKRHHRDYIENSKFDLEIQTVSPYSVKWYFSVSPEVHDALVVGLCQMFI